MTRVAFSAGLVLLGFGAGLILAANVWVRAGGERGRQDWYVCAPHE